MNKSRVAKFIVAFIQISFFKEINGKKVKQKYISLSAICRHIYNDKHAGLKYSGRCIEEKTDCFYRERQEANKFINLH